MRYESSADRAFLSPTSHSRQISLALVVVFLALTIAGCSSSDQTETNDKLIRQQQQQLETQQRQIEAIQAKQRPRVATSPPGGCDKQAEQAATEQGDERFVSSDFAKALGYYQDAQAACPKDDRANVNLARTYEALHDNAQAIKYYRKAAETSGPTVSDAQEEAKSALVRLQSSHLQ